MITIVMLVLAAFCFALVSINKGHERLNLTGLGLLFWVLAHLLPALRAMG